MPFTRHSNLERHGDPERIGSEDIAAAREFLKRKHRGEVRKAVLVNKSELLADIAPLLLSHADRVRENVRWIANFEKLDSLKLELAAILHDYSKLDYRYKNGGVNFYNHAQDAQGVVYRFTHETLHKQDSLAIEIGLLVLRHGRTPLCEGHSVRVIDPETPEEWALWAANLLDAVDSHGMRIIVEMRQLPETTFFKDDKGEISNAFAAALKLRNESLKWLMKFKKSPQIAKTIAAQFIKRSEKFITVIARKKISTLYEFRDFCDDYFKNGEKFTAIPSLPR